MMRSMRLIPGLRKSRIYCGSHVKRALTRSDGKVEKDTVTLSA